MAVLTPTFWAIGCIVDSCLIDSKIYRSPLDGAVVSCLFCLVPALVILGVDTTTIINVISDQGVPLNAAVAGLAYAVSLIFYFRTLHCLNDVAGTETFLSLSVLTVPMFAWWILDELLPAYFYLAFVIAATGVLVQCWPVIRKVGSSILRDMVVSVLAVSLSMVLQADALKSHGFSTANLVFNATCFSVAAVLLAYDRSCFRRTVHAFRHYSAILIIAEILGVFAILTSHRATQQGPSVSAVALIECLLPLIIIAISGVLIGVNRFVPLLSKTHLMTLDMQVRQMPAKVGALMLLMISLLGLLAV